MLGGIASGLEILLVHASRETAVKWLRELADEIENEAAPRMN
jgi:hypothetical protein